MTAEGLNDIHLEIFYNPCSAASLAPRVGRRSLNPRVGNPGGFFYLSSQHCIGGYVQLARERE